jgi:hypothetical protein
MLAWKVHTETQLCVAGSGERNIQVKHIVLSYALSSIEQTLYFYLDIAARAAYAPRTPLGKNPCRNVIAVLIS